MVFCHPDSTTDDAEIDLAIGAASATDSDLEAAEKAIAAIRALLAKVGIPVSLREIGIQDEHLESISTLSMGAARLVENNPRPLDPASIKSILTQAMKAA